MKNSILFLIVIANCILSSITILPQELLIKPEEFLKSINERMLLNGDYSLNHILHYYKNDNHLPFDNPGRSDWLISSHTFQKWNGASWVNDSCEVYNYNEYLLLSEKLIRDWIASQWSDDQRYFYNYNSSLSLIEDILQYKSGGVWVDSLKNFYTYNSIGQLSTVNTYIWNNSFWENYKLATSTYINNQLSEELIKGWNGSSWENSSRNTYIYDVNSINISTAFWLFGTWINILRVGFYYNNVGMIAELRIQYWDFLSGWVNITHLLFTYDNEFNIIEGLWQDWDTGSSSWINYSRTTSTYRPGNIPVNDLTELWINNNWVYESLRTYEFDGNSNLSQIITQLWNGTWINNIKQTFDYVTDVSETKIHPSDFYLLQNYPNPFNPSTSIQYTVRSRQYVLLKVYDILGNEVATLVNEEKPAGTYEVSFNAAEFGSGVYIFIKSRKFCSVKKNDFT